jgi:hypothetical protein
MQYTAAKNVKISNPASGRVSYERNDRSREIQEIAPYRIERRIFPT